jgi:hypothetical protein
MKKINQVEAEVEEKLKTEMRAGEVIRFEPFEYPTDNFMAQLTCGVFENIRMLAGFKKTYGIEKPSWSKKRLNEYIEFAEGDSYWWDCLAEFCPSLDRKKVAREIIKTAKATIAKL